MEGVEFQWNQPLIVIHAEHPIPIAIYGLVEECIRRKRPREIDGGWWVIVAWKSIRRWLV